MRTTRVRGQPGTVHNVPAFDEFERTIQGETFLFVITQDLSGTGFNVTHKASGARVCVIADAIRDVENASLSARAEDCMNRLIDRIGEARMRSVLSGAPDLPPLKWLAGWNMPGCMPEEPYAEFDTFDEARDYIVGELEREAEGVAIDAETVEDAEEIRRIDAAIAWAKRQRDAFTISPVNRYAYEVTRQK